MIRHGDMEAVTSWAEKSGEQLLQWVAFYSDCEHEIRYLQLQCCVLFTHEQSMPRPAF